MDFTTLVGQSTAFLDAIEQASRAAALNRPILVIGERGTGKELVAARLHHLSPRWDGPLITLNCAALPETLIEAELFGHEAGAFTGATRQRAGRFEEAEGGTLFLDELATLSMAAQERLLRVIEYGEVTRIGTSHARRVDVRIVAATNEHLPALVARGRFRADLLDRLSFDVITLPPLRARSGDVAVLADHFGRRMAAELGWEGWPGFGVAGLTALEDHRWPGNVRELRNTVERAVYRWGRPDCPIDTIIFDPFDSIWGPADPVPAGAETFAPPVSPSAGSSSAASFTAAPVPPFPIGSFRDAVQHYERALLDQALARHRHNQRRCAAALGLSYDQLRHAMRRLGMKDRQESA